MGRYARTARALADARETMAAWALRLAAADKRMAALERELSWALAQLERRQNDIVSLEESLDTSLGEKLRLSDRLSERSVVADRSESELNRAKAALKACKAERERANGHFSLQIAELTARLENASSRAVTAEQLVSELQQKLLESDAENGRANRRLAASEAALREKESQVQALRQAQSKLLDKIKSRDSALGRAEERIGALANLFFKLEAKTGHLPTRQETENAKSFTGNAPVLDRNMLRATSVMLIRDLDSDDWLFGGEGSVLPS